jgi:hypothetical protein
MRYLPLTALLIIFVANQALAAAPLEFKHGVALYPDNSEGKRSVHVIVDERELLDSFGYWKDKKGIRAETTETEFRSHPYTFSAAFALYGVSAVLHRVTSMLSGLPTKVFGEIIESDLYGHPQRHPMFSFTFTSDMASKIDWEGFDAESFQDIAPDFHYSLWFEHHYRSQPPE